MVTIFMINFAKNIPEMVVPCIKTYFKVLELINIPKLVGRWQFRWDSSWPWISRNRLFDL